MPKRGLRSALDQAPRCVPLAEGDRVIEPGAAGDTGAGFLDIRATIQQSVQNGHIVAAGSPVERQLGWLLRVRLVGRRVGISSSLDEYCGCLRPIREMPGPIRDNV